MLVLTLKSADPGDILSIGDDIQIRVLAIDGSQVSIGIDAPKAVPITRAKAKAKEAKS